MSGFVTIRKYLDPIEAQLDRARLEAEDLPAQVVDPTGFNPLLIGAAGGVTLGVRAQDVQRAEAILAEPAPDPIEDDEDDAGPTKVRCPLCEGEYCSFERARLRSRGAGATPLAIIELPFMLFGAKRWRCDQCEHVWDDAGAGPKQRTRPEPGDPRPVFRLHRGHPFMGLFLGSMIGLVPSVLSVLLPSGMVWLGVICLAGIVVGPVLGWSLGSRAGADVCSEPRCRARLPPGVETCPECKGSLAGRVRSAAEHYAAVADFRRELAAVRAKDAAVAERAERRAKKKAQKALR